tara:strand:- start:12071 stop:13654 length:1584 start_codon:yes stop_codon:yes gene_type:complete
MNISELQNQYSQLKNKRQNWESHWQEIADFVLPRKADVNIDRTEGDKRTNRIFDGTALHASELLSSSLHGMLTNAATPWFSMRFKDENLAMDEESREWLEASTRTMYIALNRSNFQQEIHELYVDLVVFGTACMMIEEDEEKLIRFSTRHIKEIYIAENDKGFVDTIHRSFKMSARSAVKRFGDGAGKRILAIAKDNPYDEVDIHHCVKPNDQFNPYKMDNKSMAFVSVYYDHEDGHIISISGFEEFPFVIPRWLKSSAESWGRSPSMIALPDIKMLNRMAETTIKAAQKMVDPPLLVPDDSFVLPVRTQPGGLNYYRSGSRDRIEPLNIGANTPVGINLEEQRRGAIRQAYYVDQFLMQQDVRMTATEVMQRNEEKMRLLAPVLGRMQSEMLQPLITRCFNILLRKKMLPIPPESLQGQTIDIEYVSPLARSQRTGEIQAILRSLEIIAPLGQSMPVMDYIDSDKLVQHITDILGVPKKVLRSDQEVAQIRAEQQQAAQEQAEIQQAQQLAQSAGQAAPLLKALNE